MPAHRLLTLAAADRPGLVSALQRLREQPLDALAATLDRQPATSGRERIAILAPLDAIAASLDAAIARLPALSSPRWVSRPHGIYFRSGYRPGRVAFLFPGQGSEHIGMLRELRRRSPIVARWFDALEQAAIELGRPSPARLLEPEDTDEARRGAERALRRMEEGAQLGSVAALAMHEVARALGLRADVHVGHSNGEHPAVIAAGRVAAPIDEVCRGFLQLGIAGSLLPRPVRNESLLTIAAVPADRLEQWLDQRRGVIHFAMDNCPSQAVVGGAADDIERFAADVVAANGIAAALPFERAYHTPLFHDWSATLATYYERLPIVTAATPVYSCHTVAPLPDDPAACRQTMAAQWMGRVRFADTIRHLHDHGITTFIELGPDNRLTPFVEDTLRGRPHVAVSLNAAGRDEATQLRTALGELFVAGFDLDPRAVDALWQRPADRRDGIAGEATPEQIAAVHRRLIADARVRLARASALVAPAAARPVAVPAPLIGDVTEQGASGLRASTTFTRVTHPCVEHHALGRMSTAHPEAGSSLPVIAFTMSLEIVAEAARRLSGQPVHTIRSARGSRWLALDHGTLDLDIHAEGADAIVVKLRDRGAAVPMPAFEATVTAEPARPVEIADDPSATAPQLWSAADFYARYAFHGPAFQGISRVTAVGAASIAAELQVHALPGIATDQMVLDPALLDCAGQLVAFWLLEQQRRPPVFGVFPFRLAGVSIALPPRPPGSVIYARARVTEQGGTTTADVSFVTGDGAFLMGVTGLEQRILPFPDAMARRLIQSETNVAPSQADAEFLASSWHIWERTLAHLALSARQRAEWRGLGGPSPERVQWLIRTLARGVSGDS